MRRAGRRNRGGRNKKLLTLARKLCGCGSSDEEIEVLEGNRNVFDLLALAATQWRVGLGGAYGLDYGVIIEMAHSLGIVTDRTFFEKVRTFEIEVLRIWGKRNDEKEQNCDEKQKKRCKVEFGKFYEWACKNCEKKVREDNE